jgi:transcriptional enhancer factor
MQLTDNWRTAGIYPSNCPVIPEVVTRSSRALQVTSGNAQSYNLENFKVEEAKTQPGNSNLSLDFQPQSYPVPPTLRSNAPQTITPTQRLEQRRLHRAQVALREPRGSGPSRRRFLKSAKYVEYRQRARRDTGPDGEPVWPDELEDVFQDGRSISLRVVYLAMLTSKSTP